MTKRGCANCVYSYCSLHMRIGGFTTGFGSRPLCSNHPDAPGQLREVSSGGICRNFRAKPPAPAQPEETVRRISMAHGLFVLVDAANYEWLNKYKWSPRGSGRYAGRKEKGKTIYMHRQIMNAPRAWSWTTSTATPRTTAGAICGCARPARTSATTSSGSVASPGSRASTETSGAASGS